MWPKMHIIAHKLYCKSAKFYFAITKVEEEKMLNQILRKRKLYILL